MARPWSWTSGPAVGGVLPLPDELLRAYLGGAGLGTWLMHQLSPPGVDPLPRTPRWRSCSPRWSAPR